MNTVTAIATLNNLNNNLLAAAKAAPNAQEAHAAFCEEWEAQGEDRRAAEAVFYRASCLANAEESFGRGWQGPLLNYLDAPATPKSPGGAWGAKGDWVSFAEGLVPFAELTPYPSEGQVGVSPGGGTVPWGRGVPGSMWYWTIPVHAPHLA